MNAFYRTVSRGSVRFEDALSLFDSLDAVELDAMLGRWLGAEFPTGHPLDGVLSAYGWQGKHFRTAEHVDPLLFTAGDACSYRLRPLGATWAVQALQAWPALKTPAAARWARPLLPLLSTQRSQARLRMLEFRGVATAAMVYDTVPIIDVFRRIDEARVLGLMDMKGLDRPFFFLLRRG
ncbi:DUF4334 domain-containing protein [Ramlibacter rhizophilus]|uniref:DUF4334 domain-containing protein n=1 Tax=Ramlibacter rhizophilus TaxID=1781167 RepID=UPI001F0E9844|nr:DUF4334 domain-containing protein [Ramlibacter rhizophilus]